MNRSGTRVELQGKNNGEYACRGCLTRNVNDAENRLDPPVTLYVTGVIAGYAGAPADLRTVETTFDRFRSTMTVVLETNASWPLDVIDDRNMQTLPLKVEVCMPVKDGYSLCRRPISARLAVPRIKTYVPVKLD